MKNNTESTVCLCRVLHAYALRLTCGNKYLAHDLLQETLARITRRATACPATIMSFTIWAKLVMKGAFHDTVPDAQKRELYNLFYHGTLNPMAPQGSETHGLREQIHIMSRLSPCEAAAMTLLLNGYSVGVIADEMDVSVKRVEYYLAKARLSIMGVCGS